MKFLALSIGTLGSVLFGIGLNQINYQMQSKFQKLQQTEFMKSGDTISAQTIQPNFSFWALIYSSGSFSYLRQLIDQIQFNSDVKLVKVEDGAMTTSSQAYLPKVKNLISLFLKDLDWRNLISTNDVPQEVKSQKSQLSANFLQFKSKFFELNHWIELGIASLIIEAIFLFTAIASVILIFFDKKLSKKEKLKWNIYYLCTNLLGWIYLNYLHKKILIFWKGKDFEQKIKLKKEDYQLFNTSGITLSNLSFFREKCEILKGIDLQLEAGQFYAIIGPNGAGKTSLLKNVGGILSSKEGEVIIGGKNLLSIPKKTFWQKVVYIPQELEIQPDTPVYDFLLYSRFISLKRTQKATPEDHQRVVEAIKKCGLEEFRYSRMGELSGGQRQKVVLASIMVKNAELILLDEPTTHLDIENRLFLISFFKELKDKNKIVIANLHNFAEISELSSQIIAIKNGEIAKFSTKNQVLKANFLNELYDLNLSKEKWNRILNIPLLGY